MTDLTLLARTTADLDAEAAQLAIERDEALDSEVAGRLEVRRLDVLDARRVAHAREQAQQRRKQAEQDAADLFAFRTLVDEFEATLGAQAQALDRWLAEGAGLTADYRALVQRLGGAFEAVLRRPVPGCETELLFARGRLLLDEQLLDALARAGVLPQVVLQVSSHAPWPSVSDFVAGRWRGFVTVAAARTPDGERPTTSHVVGDWARPQ